MKYGLNKDSIKEVFNWKLINKMKIVFLRMKEEKLS